LVALKQLNLGNNKLTSLPPDIFRGLVALEKLKLLRNPLGSCSEEALNALPRSVSVILPVSEQEGDQSEQEGQSGVEEYQ
jgi:Leucine-rich repeat (LRR) protein